MKYIIYKHTSPSLKYYIGITSESLNHRWLGHCRRSRFGSMTNFHKAIRKYGEENWIHEVLYEFETDDKRYAYQVEQEWIDKYDAVSKGYNMEVGFGWNIADRAGSNNPMYGRVSGNAHTVVINGDVYSSVTEAAVKLEINRATVQRWIANPNNNNCYKF